MESKGRVSKIFSFLLKRCPCTSRNTPTSSSFQGKKVGLKTYFFCFLTCLKTTIFSYLFTNDFVSDFVLFALLFQVSYGIKFLTGLTYFSILSTVFAQSVVGLYLSANYETIFYANIHPWVRRPLYRP